ncbi:MAG: DUF4924 family protein [Prolixibacteraceae bacterium]|nr:DUF4924 family protein [Prolixibacteraceae bacterium]
MLVANEKRQTNISEYILYMWQVEDIIRAFGLDMVKLQEHVISKYSSRQEEVRKWYNNLVLMMKKEQKQLSGHLQFLVNLTEELNRFHLLLIQKNTDPEYSLLYSNIKADIQHVREKSGHNHHDVEVSLNTLYIILMLKLKNQEISEGTQQAVWKFGNLMGHLSKLYRAYETGSLEIE